MNLQREFVRVFEILKLFCVVIECATFRAENENSFLNFRHKKASVLKPRLNEAYIFNYL